MPYSGPTELPPEELSGEHPVTKKVMREAMASTLETSMKPMLRINDWKLWGGISMTTVATVFMAGWAAQAQLKGAIQEVVDAGVLEVKRDVASDRIRIEKLESDRADAAAKLEQKLSKLEEKQDRMARDHERAQKDIYNAIIFGARSSRMERPPLSDGGR